MASNTKALIFGMLVAAIVVVASIVFLQQRTAEQRRQEEAARQAAQQRTMDENNRKTQEAVIAEANRWADRTARATRRDELEGKLKSQTLTPKETFELMELRPRVARDIREATEEQEDRRLKEVIKSAVQEAASSPR